MATEVNPNLSELSTFTYKDLLLRKLYYAVASSVVSQLILILIYVFLANTNILHPLEWLKATLQTFTYISTWCFVLVFVTIIFSQCLICAKDYVLMNTFCSTRFQQFLHVFSLHNFTLLSLHTLIGGVSVWQFLSLVDSHYQNLLISKDSHYVLVDGTFFLILNGFWVGFYYFIRIYVSSRHLIFPVIQQKKFLQFRNNFYYLLKDSFSLSLWPTLYFVIFHYFWGFSVKNRFTIMLGLLKQDSYTSLLFYVYIWWFSSLYFFSMNLMRFFFYLFLTEPTVFPVVKSDQNLTIQEGILLNNLPIVQNLACLDLYLLAKWSESRRQILFSLSEFGAHPHNWNALVENILKLFTEYTDLLNKSTANQTIQSIQQTSELHAKIPYRNLRNMSLHKDDLDIVEISHEVPLGNANLQQLKQTIQLKFNNFIEFLKVIFGINYLFNELPQANIQKCLSNGQIIIWASQGISELFTVSLSEDKYGIVQKDFPVILTSLVNLKQSLDKLNKIPALSKKIKYDFNYKMKNAVNSAVKRSLFNICASFGPFFKDFSINKETLCYLQTNVTFKN